MSPGRRRPSFLPKSDPAAPFFVLHRPAQRMGVIGAGDKVLCACLRPRSVLQGCHEGALTVSPARCESVRWVSARRCRRFQGCNSESACRHGAVSVTIACHHGAINEQVRRCLVLDAICIGAICVLLGCCERAAKVLSRTGSTHNLGGPYASFTNVTLNSLHCRCCCMRLAKLNASFNSKR